jgi:hypothetical protein
MPTITSTTVELEHPYRVGGAILALVSFAILAFSLGFLSRCAEGRGLCFDTQGHAAGDAGLVAFILVFIIGVALMAYTGSTASFTTRTKTPEAVVAPTASVTNVYPQAALPPPTLPPTVTNVYTQAPPAAPATTVIVPPR